MATFYKFNVFVEDLASGVHDLTTDTLKVAFFPAASAPTATDELLGSMSGEITYTNVVTSPTTVRSLGTPTTAAETGGVFTLDYADMTVLASGGAIAAFQYIVVYNDSTTVKTDPVIGWYDYGSDLTLTTGQTLLISFNASGIFTIT